MATLFAAHHGVHPAAAGDGTERLCWGPQTSIRRYDSVRVHRHTCGLDSYDRVVYELCHAGGQAFIRRTTRDGRGGVSVAETAPMPVTTGDQVWARLVSGRAR